MGNIHLSVSISMHMLASDSVLAHVNWVSSEAVAEGLSKLLATLWQETRPLFAGLFSLMHHNAWKIWDRVDWAEYHALLLIHYLCRLYLELNTWFICVEYEVGDIDLPSMTGIHFEIN